MNDDEQKTEQTAVNVGKKIASTELSIPLNIPLKGQQPAPVDQASAQEQTPEASDPSEESHEPITYSHPILTKRPSHNQKVKASQPNNRRVEKNHLSSQHRIPRRHPEQTALRLHLTNNPSSNPRQMTKTRNNPQTLQLRRPCHRIKPEKCRSKQQLQNSSARQYKMSLLSKSKRQHLKQRLPPTQSLSC
jgi:hypothetical protein